jgi:hypothetical protein
MYHREHDRWNQWALFFFGSIVTVFLLWDQVKTFPLWVPALICFLLSCMWVAVALSIRASTWAWREAVKEIEAQPTSDGPAFKTFEDKLDKFKRLGDLRTTLTRWRSESFMRVTRMLTLLGVMAALIFLALSVASYGGWIKNDAQLRSNPPCVL